MTEKTDTLDDNINAFQKISDELHEHHLGKFVLMHNSQFIASYDNFDNAARAAIERFGRGPYLIRQVGAPTEMTLPASIAYRPDYANH